MITIIISPFSSSDNFKLFIRNKFQTNSADNHGWRSSWRSFANFTWSPVFFAIATLSVSPSLWASNIAESFLLRSHDKNTHWTVSIHLLDFGCWALSPRLIPSGLNIFCWIKIRTWMSLERAWNASQVNGLRFYHKLNLLLICLIENVLIANVLGVGQFSLLWGGILTLIRRNSHYYKEEGERNWEAEVGELCKPSQWRFYPLYRHIIYVELTRFVYVECTICLKLGFGGQRLPQDCYSALGSG